MNAGKREKRRRVRIQPYVAEAIAQRLVATCAATGETESAVVQEALRQYLDRTGDMTLVFRRLDRLGRAVENAHRDLTLLTEAFAIWTKLWFAHTPSIPEDGKRAARTAAEGRYRQFVDHVAAQVAAGHRFASDMAGDDQESGEDAVDRCGAS